MWCKGNRMPKAMSNTRTISKKGVRNFPIISTIFDLEIESTKTTPKNTAKNAILGKSGNKGAIPTSKVVEPVRGMAMSGPIHNITNSVSHLMSSG